MQYKKEFIRKLIHISSLWIPVLYLYTTTAVMLKILFPLVIGALLIEIIRKRSSKLNSFIITLIGSIMRDEEKNSRSFAGATHLFMSSTLTIAFFNKDIAIFALFILIISDTFAALVGQKFPIIRIGSKSLVGSLSFAISSYFIYYYLLNYHYFDLPFFQSMIAILFATLIELFAKRIKIDDNFLIPFAVGMIMVW